jgi:hypothetical protein
MLSYGYLLKLVSLACLVDMCIQSSLFEPQRALKESTTRQPTKRLSIPGGTAFEFCLESNPDTDLFAVERIVWDPNPPIMHVIYLFSKCCILFAVNSNAF